MAFIDAYLLTGANFTAWYFGSICVCEKAAVPPGPPDIPGEGESCSSLHFGGALEDHLLWFKRQILSLLSLEHSWLSGWTHLSRMHLPPQLPIAVVRQFFCSKKTWL